MRDAALWARIEACPLDAPGVELPFSGKLREEAGWSDADTRRVLAEYRRFLYLALMIKVPPAPPAPIDAAWRMHLTYTRAYWEAFVPEVLRRPFHREAAVVEDRAARRRFYRAATEAYRREFGEAPPRDIWVHPMRPNWSAVFATAGILGCLLTSGALALAGWILGVPVDGLVSTLPETIGAVSFLLCFALLIFSPLWGWIATRFQTRLRTSRTRRWMRFVIGVTAGR